MTCNAERGHLVLMVVLAAIIAHTTDLSLLEEAWPVIRKNWLSPAHASKMLRKRRLNLSLERPGFAIGHRVQESYTIVVGDDRFALGIPFDAAAQLSTNVAEVARRNTSMRRLARRDTWFSRFDAVDEITCVIV